jgi:hypothetical protein
MKTTFDDFELDESLAWVAFETEFLKYLNNIAPLVGRLTSPDLSLRGNYGALRNNYLFWLWRRNDVIKKLRNACGRNEDLETLALLSVGSRRKRKIKGDRTMLEVSNHLLNWIGETFGLEAVYVRSDKHPIQWLPEADNFSRIYSWCLDNARYPVVLGGFLADLLTSLTVIRVFNSALIESVADDLEADSRAKRVERLDLLVLWGHPVPVNVFLRKVLYRNCDTQRKMNEAVVGMRLLLEAQSALWVALLAKLDRGQSA